MVWWDIDDPAQLFVGTDNGENLLEQFHIEKCARRLSVTIGDRSLLFSALSPVVMPSIVLRSRFKTLSVPGGLTTGDGAGKMLSPRW